MAVLKTRDTSKGTIKTINKAAVATERMKKAYVMTKDKAEHILMPMRQNFRQCRLPNLGGAVTLFVIERAWAEDAAASALTEAVLAFAKENGFEQLNLEVRSDNARAIRLYEKYAFGSCVHFRIFSKSTVNLLILT